MILKINGVAIKDPFSFSVDIMDLDSEDATRNAQGDLIRDRIAVKRKLFCQWPPLKDSEISTLLQAVKNPFFTVEYPDPMEGERVTKTFYVSNRTVPMYRYDSTKGIHLWESLSMNFIER